MDFEKLEQVSNILCRREKHFKISTWFIWLKIRYLELSVRVFEAKNRSFKDEMDWLFKNRVLELEDKKIEISQKDIMNEIEILAKQIDDKNVWWKQ